VGWGGFFKGFTASVLQCWGLTLQCIAVHCVSVCRAVRSTQLAAANRCWVPCAAWWCAAATSTAAAHKAASLMHALCGRHFLSAASRRCARVCACACVCTCASTSLLQHGGWIVRLHEARACHPPCGSGVCVYVCVCVCVYAEQCANTTPVAMMMTLALPCLAAGALDNKTLSSVGCRDHFKTCMAVCSRPGA
jgi:hypothetical protein